MLTLTHLWPEWTRLYWLFCAPIAAALLFALYRVKRQQQTWHSLLPSAFHAVLLGQNAARQRKAPYLLLAAAWLCALIALLGPSWQASTPDSDQQPQLAPLVIAIQLTPELLATDLPPNRLSHVREKILHILKLRGDAVTALVVYAGSAHTLVPLSNDPLTSENLLQALHPDLMPKPGQRADRAVQQAIHLLQQGAQGSGQIVLISTGVSATEHSAIKRQLKNHPVQLKIMGVGSTAGAPIVQSQQGNLLTDSSGAIVISRLDTVSLQLLAQETASPYVQLSAEHSDVHALDLFSQSSSTLLGNAALNSSQQRDFGYWLVLPVLFLTAVFARRGGLALLLLISLLPTPSYAVEWADLWLRPDQRGAKLIEQQPARAAEYFTDPLWRATALYLAEDYLAAAQLFANFDTAQAHYNRGNALALAGQLSEALDAYQHALLRDPDLLAAQYNHRQVAELLAAQSSNSPNPQQDAPATPALPTAELSSATAPGHTAVTAAAQSEDSSSIEPAAAVPPAPNEHNPARATEEHSSAPVSASPPAQQEHSVQLESWLEQIPDQPSELLKRKFQYEQRMQEVTP